MVLMREDAHDRETLGWRERDISGGGAIETGECDEEEERNWKTKQTSSRAGLLGWAQEAGSDRDMMKMDVE